jgi:hypothetical protein
MREENLRLRSPIPEGGEPRKYRGTYTNINVMVRGYHPPGSLFFGTDMGY